MTSAQTLSEPHRRTIARWAAECAEHVLRLFEADAAAEAQVRDALARTRAFSAGESTAAEEIRRRLVAVKAASAATTPAGASAARAVSLANPLRPEAVEAEIRWQLRLLPPLGASSSGPLGPGLLSRGVLGATFRVIQAELVHPGTGT